VSLDEDVNLKLKSWHVPDNEFTKNQKVTLRRLLNQPSRTFAISHVATEHHAEIYTRAPRRRQACRR